MSPISTDLYLFFPSVWLAVAEVQFTAIYFTISAFCVLNQIKTKQNKTFRSISFSFYGKVFNTFWIHFHVYNEEIKVLFLFCFYDHYIVSIPLDEKYFLCFGIFVVKKSTSRCPNILIAYLCILIIVSYFMDYSYLVILKSGNVNFF